MTFSIENGFFIPSPSLAAEKQGPGLKFSSENEIFNPEKEKFKRESATGKYGCREVRVYPAECGEQLGRDP